MVQFGTAHNLPCLQLNNIHEAPGFCICTIVSHPVAGKRKDSDY